MATERVTWAGQEETWLDRWTDEHKCSVYSVLIGVLVVGIGVAVRWIDSAVYELPWKPGIGLLVMVGALTVLGLVCSLYRLDKWAATWIRWPIAATNVGLRESATGIPNRKFMRPTKDGVVLTVDSGSKTESEWKKLAPGVARVLGWPRVTVEKTKRSVRFEFYRTTSSLDADSTIHEPVKMDFDGGLNIYAFRDEFGNALPLRMGNTSGVVIGGVPGAGKTALLNTLLVPMLRDDRVHVSITDGKGGADLFRVGQSADEYNRDDEDLEHFLDMVNREVSIMKERVETGIDLTGSSNFWDTEVTPDRPVRVLIVDECQTFFEKTGRNKDDKALIEQITAGIQRLIKQGRSAGIIVMLLTQKPTSEAIPTGIRDNSGLKVCMRVTTLEAAKAVFGSSLGDDGVSPLDIPAERRGGAVIATDSGHVESVRAFYTPETELADLL